MVVLLTAAVLVGVIVELVMFHLLTKIGEVLEVVLRTAPDQRP